MSTPTDLSRSEARQQDRRVQIAWVKAIMAREKASASALAVSAGLSDTTLSQWLAGRHGGTLSQATISALQRRYHVPPPGAGEIVAPQRGFAEEEAAPCDAGADAGGRSDLVEALIAGGPDRFAYTMKADVLALAGVLPGDVMIIDMAAAPRDGDVVCVQVEQGLGARTIYRLYRPPHLLGAALNPHAVRPEIVDGARVRIAGVMTDLLRRRS